MANEHYPKAQQTSAQLGDVRKFLSVAIVASLLLCACGHVPANAQPAAPQMPTVNRTPPASVGLAINGFNYTDLYIDSFEVDGAGGGNLEVSDAQAGGGGGVCCYTLYRAQFLPRKVMIKWTRGAHSNPWCEKEAVLTGPIPPNPNHLGVHFFPDGHIELEVTEDYPQVKLKLDRYNRIQRKATGNTVVDAQVATCRKNYYGE